MEIGTGSFVVKKMKKILVAGLWLLFIYLPASADEVEWYVFDTSGGEANGGGWGIDSSMGQPIYGKSTGGGYSCEVGYIGGLGVVQADTFTLTATAISPALVRLEWNNIAGETGFAIERREGGGGYSKIIELAVDTITFNDTYQLKADILNENRFTKNMWV